MASKETLESIEKGLDAIEHTLDVIEDPVAYIAKMKKQHLIYLLIGTQVAWWGGGTLAYFLTKKHLTAKYDKISKEEIEEAKAFYARHYKKDDFETPQTAVEALGAQAAVEALDAYQSKAVVVEEEVVVELTPVPQTKNIFTPPQEDVTWNLEEEMKNRTEEEPYVISQDEFQQDDRDYRQVTLSYFAEDDVLVDEQEKPIEEVDQVVGEGNLTRFGHGSNDNRIVYIRNDRLSMDFEIVKSEGSYAKEVLGFQHSDGSRKVPKFRGDGD